MNGINNINSLSSSNLSTTSYEANKSASEIESFSQVLDQAYESKDDDKLREACQEFEAYFIQQMYKSMQSTIDDSDSLFKKSNATKTYTDFLIEEQSKVIASGQGLGLTDMMYDSMKAQQEALEDPINNNLYGHS